MIERAARKNHISWPVVAGVLLAAWFGLIILSKWRMPKAARKETVITQRIVMDALSRYREATGAHPPDASEDCATLMVPLHEQPSCVETLKKLPKDAWAGPGSPLRDGFGESMRYRPTGGYKGSPLLWSRGGDRKWDTDDDIRSDGQ